MKFEYNKALTRLKIAFEIVEDVRCNDDSMTLFSAYEKMFDAVDELLKSEKTKEERIKKLTDYGFTKKEAKRIRNGYALIIDGSVLRDDPDSNFKPIVEADVKDVKVFWIEDLPMQIQDTAEKWEILNMDNLKIVERGLIKEGTSGKKPMDEV